MDSRSNSNGELTVFPFSNLGNKEHSKQSYEVLVADSNARYEWIGSSNGQVPQGAIQGGHTNTGKPI